MLWDYSLVMQDEESGSYWSHILGDCTEGQHKGKSLEMIPSVLTGFANWTREHPDTTVMDWPSFQDQNWKSDTYEVLSHDKFAIGLVGDHETSHFVFSDLLEHPVVNFEFEGQPLVLRFNPETGAGWCFHRELDTQRLSFKLENKAWIDNETGSVWSVSGIAQSGPLQGKKLKHVVSIATQTSAWNTFHPDSVRWSPDISNDGENSENGNDETLSAEEDSTRKSKTSYVTERS